ncbi:hypothetical protein PG996_005048 [Apiospora saccharicola]|uniref:Uncharacterized protein n=1 Tax=Apiospora saccharicola TaxID=335842 RepID=A0ABR1VKF2_9PEZI
MISTRAETTHATKLPKTSIGIQQLPYEIHQMIFDAIDDPKSRTAAAFNVLLTCKQLHGMWKKFLYEDEINSGMCGPLVHGVLNGLMQPLNDIVGMGITAQGKSVNLEVRVEIPFDWHERQLLSGHVAEPCPWEHSHGGNGLTPLHLAVLRGCPDTVRILLDHGANVNAGGYTSRHDVNLARRQSALHMATYQGDLDLVRLLLDYKSCLLADPTEETGLSVLHIAALCGHEHLIRHLVTEGLGGRRSHLVLRTELLLPAGFDDDGGTMCGTDGGGTEDAGAIPRSRGRHESGRPGTTSAAASRRHLHGRPAAHQARGVECATRRPGRRAGRRPMCPRRRHPGITALDDGADVNRCFRLEYGAEEKSLLEMDFANTFGQKSLLLLQRLLERGARVQKLRQPQDVGVEDDGNCLLLSYLELLVPGYGEEQFWIAKPRYSWDELRDMELFADATANTTITTVAERKIEALLAAGARVDGVSRRGKTCLMSACELVVLFRFPLGFMRMLLVAGADPNQPSRSHDPANWRWNDVGGPATPMAACLSFPCPPADPSSSYKACELLQSLLSAIPHPMPPQGHPGLGAGKTTGDDEPPHGDGGNPPETQTAAWPPRPAPTLEGTNFWPMDGTR